MSGYLYYYLAIERDRYQKYIPFLVNKVKRLLLPYVFICIIWIVPVYIGLYGTNGIIQKYVFGDSPSQLWFLLMLFLIFAMFWWIADFSDRHPFIGLVIVGMCYMLGTALSAISIPDYYMFETALKYMIYFYLGFLIRKFGSQFLIKRIPSVVYIVVDVVIFTASLYLQSRSGLIFRAALLGVNLILHLVGAVMAFVVIQKLVNAHCKDNRILNFFSKHSMAIYLVHQQFIYFTIKWFNGVVPPVALVIINFVFALGISTLFAWLMQK